MVPQLEIDVFQNEQLCEPFLVEFQMEFLQNRRDDYEALKKAVRERDANAADKIAHKWAGMCLPYGFETLGKLGRLLSDSVLSEWWDVVDVLLSKVELYLKHKGSLLNA